MKSFQNAFQYRPVNLLTTL